MTMHTPQLPSFNAASATFGFTFPVVAAGVIVSEIDGTADLVPNECDPDDCDVGSIRLDGLADGPDGSPIRCSVELPANHTLHAPILAWLSVDRADDLTEAWQSANPRRHAV